MTDKTIEEILSGQFNAVLVKTDIQGRHFWEPRQKDVTEATKAITQAMLDALPEKQRIDSSIIRDDNELSYLMKLQICRGDGFNQAISEMETAIKKMGDK